MSEITTAAEPCCTPGVVRLDGHWLVEEHTHCTCGGSGILSPAHQRGCGLVPLVDLCGLDGWDDLIRQDKAEAWDEGFTEGANYWMLHRPNPYDDQAGEPDA